MRRDHVLQFVLEAAQTPDFQGVTAQAVADALSIWRNDAAVELNKLVAEGKLRRVNDALFVIFHYIGSPGGCQGIRPVSKFFRLILLVVA